MKNRALCIKSVKFGMVVHITRLNILRYGGVSPVPLGGRWRHLHFSSPSNHEYMCRWRHLPPGSTDAIPPYLNMFSLVMCTTTPNLTLLIQSARFDQNTSQICLTIKVTPKVHTALC